MKQQAVSPGERHYSIYQMKIGIENRFRIYEAYDRLTAAGEKPGIENYDCVYHGTMKPEDTLETLYKIFNLDFPKDYRGRSLSVSDVVVIEQKKRLKKRNREIAEVQSDSGKTALEKGGFRHTSKFLNGET